MPAGACAPSSSARTPSSPLPPPLSPRRPHDDREHTVTDERLHELLAGDDPLHGHRAADLPLDDAEQVLLRGLLAAAPSPAAVSIGIALVPEHGDDIDELLCRAGLAMYEAKRAGTGYALSVAEQEDAPARRLALFDDLRRCIDDDQLVLHYQPKIDLASGTTIGVEALIRWEHPSRGLLMPAEFMVEVENNELIVHHGMGDPRGAAPAARLATPATT